jgi:hypothetical protein
MILWLSKHPAAISLRGIQYTSRKRFNMNLLRATNSVNFHIAWDLVRDYGVGDSGPLAGDSLQSLEKLWCSHRHARLLPINALVLTDLANFRVVGKNEAAIRELSEKLPGQC